MESLAAINIRKAIAVSSHVDEGVTATLASMLRVISSDAPPSDDSLCAQLRTAASWLLPSAPVSQQAIDSLAACSFLLALLAIASGATSDSVTHRSTPLSQAAYQRHLPTDAAWRHAAAHAVKAAPASLLLHALQCGCSSDESAVRFTCVHAVEQLLRSAPDILPPAFDDAVTTLQPLATEGYVAPLPWWRYEACVLLLGACVAGGRGHAALMERVPLLTALLPPLIRTAESSYVREACVHVMCVLLEPPCALSEDSAADLLLGAAIPCLLDAKPQVRIAASMLMRTFMCTLPSVCRLNLHALVPPLCLLRYFGTERQRYTFQDTWRQLVDSAGGDGSDRVLDVSAVASVMAARDARHSVAAHALGSVACEALTRRNEHAPSVSACGTDVPSQHGAVGPELSTTLDGAAATTSGRSASPMRVQSIAASMTEALTSRSRDANACETGPGASIGPALVEAHFDALLDVYLNQLRATHPLAREAAALCLAEMSVKFDVLLVAAAAPQCIPALLCLVSSATGAADDWSSVDASVIALQRLLSRCSATVPPDLSVAVVDCLLASLTFPHKVVRDHAAAALRQLQPCVPRVAVELKAHATGAFRAFLRRDRSLALDDATAVSSCAPAVQVDGAMYALRELSVLNPRDAEALLPSAAEALSDAARLPALQENMCRILLEVMMRLGKAALKRNMELFLVSLLDMLAESREAAARTRAFAAADCLAHFQSTLGPSIFAARLTPDQAAVLARSDCMPRMRGASAAMVAARAASPSTRR